MNDADWSEEDKRLEQDREEKRKRALGILGRRWILHKDHHQTPKKTFLLTEWKSERRKNG